MKTNRYLAIVLTSIWCICQHVSGKDTNDYDHGKYIHYLVTATNGLKIGSFSGDLLSPTNPTDRPIELLFSMPDKVGWVYQPKKEYFGFFVLYDATNHSVPKTALGTSYKLTKIPRWDNEFMQLTRMGNQYVPINIDAHDGWSTGAIDLPSAAQLFKLEKPGSYRLVLEAQVFLKEGARKDIVRFPPLEIPLIKLNKPNLSPGNQTKSQVK